MPVHSKPKKPGVPYFTPDKRQCLILGNIDYAPIRYMGVDKDGNPKELGFANLPEVLQDIEVFSHNIQQYDFDEDMGDIIKKTNLNIATVKKILNKFQSRINDNADSNKKTLTVVYYGGHGMMKDNQS